MPAATDSTSPLFDPRLLDLDAAAGRLDLAEAIRPGFWREILQAVEPRMDVGVERLGQQRMHVLQGAAGNLQHGLDRGTVRRRAVDLPAVQLDVIDPRQRRRRGTAGAVDGEIVEHQRGALRHGRQPDDAAASLAPAHGQRRLRAAFGDRGRALEFGDHELGIVDLRHNQDLGEPRHERHLRRGGLRDQHHARIGAADLEPERVTRHRTIAAIIDPAGLRLLRAPGIGLHADLRGGEEPEGAPRDRGNQDRDGDGIKAEARAAAGGGGLIRHAGPLAGEFVKI
ncbi:hypothetical protein ABIF56_008680 [Bradyrhizobium elkanii]